MTINLNQNVTDPISGFTGVVTARCEYATGDTRIEITGKVNDKGAIPREWFDESRLENVQ